MKTLILLLISFLSFSQTYQDSIVEFREKYEQDLLKVKGLGFNSENIKELDYYEIDELFNVICEFKLTKKSKPIKFPTSAGTKKAFLKFGELHFVINDKKQKLSVYKSLGGPRKIQNQYLFIPFKDATSKKETYGGGRYIDFKMEDLNEDIIYLDFNKAYNPYCAFSTGYFCPIPPKENTLSEPIKAGEKQYLGEFREQ